LNSGWEREKTKFVAVAKSAIHLAQAHQTLVEYLNKLAEITSSASKSAQKKHLSSCTMMLKPLFKRTMDSFDTLEEWKDLKNKNEEIEAQIKQIA
jgi:anion-transporting  ArsA/GET3 family ATPase